MSSFISAAPVASGQVQSLDSLRGHSLPSDAMIVASATQVNPTNQNTGSYALVESANSLTLTTTGSVPVVTQSPFADLYKEGSIYFNGTVGNYVSATATGLNGTQWNTTGMTVEAWVNYPTFTGAGAVSGSVSQPYLVGQFQPAGATNYWGFGSNTLGYVTFFYWNGASQNITSSVPLSTNTWNHIAFSCLPGGATANVYVNGTQVATTSISGTPVVSSSIPLTLGQFNSFSPNLNCYVADVRITTGAALYTGSSFTVPSAPLSTASTGVTQALIRAGSNAPYVSNGALTFDRGLKQYMNFGPQTFNMYTRGFTCVFKFQFNGAVPSYGYDRIFNAATSSSQTNAIQIIRDNTNAGIAFNFFLNGSQSFYLATPSTITQNQSYVATVMYNPSVVSGTASIWINGVQVASSTGLNSSIGSTDPTIMLYNTIGAGPGLGQGAPLNGSINVMAVYNRTLSNVEIYNSYLALNTVPATPQQKTLEVGDINGVPALSVAGDGKVSVQSIGLSSNVLPWPPAAMTGYDTVINGGVYKARASYEFSSSYLAWYGFDKSTANRWAGQTGQYNNLLPYNYLGTVTTTDVNGTIYKGDWIQIQLASSILLSNYQIYYDNTTSQPAIFWVLGSRDGVNWVLVDSRNQAQPGSSGYITFTLASVPSQSFSYWRIVVGSCTNSNGTVNFVEWTLYGTADTSPALTIAPATTFNTSVATPSLTGIAGSAFVPQDFSSSGLNIPAYVVSNTATTANTVQYSSMGPFAGEGSLYFGYPPTTTLNQCGAYVNLGPTTPPNFTPVGTPFTIEGWIYVQGTSGDNIYYTLMDHGSPNSGAGSSYDMTSFVLNGSFYLTLISLSPNNVGLAGVVYNAWNHVSGSWNGTNTLYCSVNGTVASQAVTGTPAFNSAYSFLVGAQGGAYNMRGYVAGVRVTRGAALYTSSFTPPTGPLQPIQGTTQAGLPYGTVLLLRNAPAPGRIQTTKFSGANSVGLGGAPQVLSFPPAAMTGYATTLNAGYGQGTYVASASTEVNNLYLAWYAFDQIVGNWWTSAIQYNGSAPYNYTGSVTTVDVNGNSYAGEWIQIQLPSAIVPVSYTITQASGGVNQQYSPTKFWILGSRDGANWSLVDSRTGATAPWAAASPTFTVTSSQAFTYFRLVSNILLGAGTAVSISQIIFNGSIESVNVTADGRVGLGVVNPTRALEVAGDVVCGGTLSAGNPLMFRNALYNGDFRIAQRGTSFGPNPSGSYTLDRWHIESGAGLTVSQIQSGLANFSNAIQLQTSTTTIQNIYLIQPIETREVIKFQGQPVTISFWYRVPTSFTGLWAAWAWSSTGVDTKITNVSSGTGLGNAVLTNTTAWTYASFTTFVPTTVNTLEVMFLTFNNVVNGAQIQITGVQLEKGSVATPFEVRPYATELALCQRYYHRVGTATGQAPIVCPMTIITSTTAEGVYKLPVTMRSNVIAVNASGTVTLDWFGVNANSVGALAVIAAQTSTDVAAFYASSVGNGTVGSVTVGQNRFLLTIGYVDFSTEL